MATGLKLAPLPAGAPMDDGSENTHEKSHWELELGGTQNIGYVLCLVNFILDY